MRRLLSWMLQIPDETLCNVPSTAKKRLHNKVVVPINREPRSRRVLAAAKLQLALQKDIGARLESDYPLCRLLFFLKRSIWFAMS